MAIVHFLSKTDAIVIIQRGDVSVSLCDVMGHYLTWILDMNITMQ